MMDLSSESKVDLPSEE